MPLRQMSKATSLREDTDSSLLSPSCLLQHLDDIADLAFSKSDHITTSAHIIMRSMGGARCF